MFGIIFGKDDNLPNNPLNIRKGSDFLINPTSTYTPRYDKSRVQYHSQYG